MAEKIKIEGLGLAIEESLKEYSKEITETLDQIYEKKAQDLAKAIGDASPKRTGEYSRGWTYKKGNEGGKTFYIVYNESKPQLTHLLEYGHPKRGGAGWVSARPHIKPAVDRIEGEMFDEIERAIKGGG